MVGGNVTHESLRSHESKEITRMAAASGQRSPTARSRECGTTLAIENPETIASHEEIENVENPKRALVFLSFP